VVLTTAALPRLHVIAIRFGPTNIATSLMNALEDIEPHTNSSVLESLVPCGGPLPTRLLVKLNKSLRGK